MVAAFIRDRSTLVPESPSSDEHLLVLRVRSPVQKKYSRFQSGLAVPIAYVLAFPAGYGLLGLWYGMCCGYGSIALMLGAVVLRSDWPEHARRAQARAEKAGS